MKYSHKHSHCARIDLSLAPSGVHSPPAPLASLPFIRQVTCMPTEAWNVFPPEVHKCLPPAPSFFGLVSSLHSGLCFSGTLLCLTSCLHGTPPHVRFFFMHSLPLDGRWLFMPVFLQSDCQLHKGRQTRSLLNHQHQA